MSIVLQAYEFWENKVDVLYHLIHNLEEEWFKKFKSQEFELHSDCGNMVRDHHGDMAIAWGEYKQLRITKHIGMLPRYNSCSEMSMSLPTYNKKLAGITAFGYRSTDNVLDSTVTVEPYNITNGIMYGKVASSMKTMNILSIDDIIQRHEEIEFQLLLDMKEEHIFYFTLNSICSQMYPNVGIEITCEVDDLDSISTIITEYKKKLKAFISVQERMGGR